MGMPDVAWLTDLPLDEQAFHAGYIGALVHCLQAVQDELMLHDVETFARIHATITSFDSRAVLAMMKAQDGQDTVEDLSAGARGSIRDLDAVREVADADGQPIKSSRMIFIRSKHLS